MLLKLLCCCSPRCSPAFAKAAQSLLIRCRRLMKLSELRCLVVRTRPLPTQRRAGVDLREIREKIQTGMSDAEIKDFMVARYGDFVLYRPPVKNTTLVLWVGPFLLLAVGGGILVFNLRRRRQHVTEPELSRDEQALAESLLHTDPTKETT
jgi:cytochrome c-type biogenesis protein CcmH